MGQKDPNNYVGSVFVWEQEKVKAIMDDIVAFTKQTDNNQYTYNYGKNRSN